MEIYDLKEKQEYLKEVMTLEHDEWGKEPEKEREARIKRKIEKYFASVNDPYFCKLILLDGDILVGFISIFPHDCKEELDLTPWYATMFVKKEYRKKGYSKILNEAILKEAKNRNIQRLYLKTDLEQYYEKLGAQFIKELASHEKLYQFKINE